MHGATRGSLLITAFFCRFGFCPDDKPTKKEGILLNPTAPTYLSRPSDASADSVLSTSQRRVPEPESDADNVGSA